MKIALSVWQGYISTVFDAANLLLVFEQGQENSRKGTLVTIKGSDMAGKAMQVKEKGVGVLICGAISRPLEQTLESLGVTVHPFIRGPVEDVIDAYLKGNLDNIRFVLPGCRKHRHMGRSWRNCAVGFKQK